MHVLTTSLRLASFHNFTMFFCFLVFFVSYFLTGEIAPVDGSLMDLRAGVQLGSRLSQVFGAPGVEGFDHNFCVVPSEDLPVARVIHRPSGRVLEVYTDQPGVQLYTANYLQGLPGKSGAVYKKHSSLALETQNYPDAVNHVSEAIKYFLV